MKDLPRELVEVGEVDAQGLCPCCRQERLPIGLFAQNPEIVMPDALQQMIENGQVANSLPSETLYACGRFFCKVDVLLPLGRMDSPICARIWAEIEQDDFEELSYIEEGAVLEVEIEGILATDIPGFPGSIGSRVLIEHNQQRLLPVIINCSDQRLQMFDSDADHDTMVDLYRRVWGNDAGVAEADPEMRATVNEQFHSLIKAPLYRRYMTPPPGFAGIRPAEVLVAPPLDTGDEAVMATIGCSDVAAEHSSPVELITWVRNPSDSFIKTFADFGYLSRLNEDPITKGLLVPERPGVPGSNDKMFGWLLWDLWKEPEEKDILTGTHGEEVKVLSAVPIHEIEVLFAHAFGPERLAQLLFAEDVDPADLTRPPVVPLNEDLELD